MHVSQLNKKLKFKNPSFNLVTAHNLKLVFILLKGLFRIPLIKSTIPIKEI